MRKDTRTVEKTEPLVVDTGHGWKICFRSLVLDSKGRRTFRHKWRTGVLPSFEAAQEFLAQQPAAA